MVFFAFFACNAYILVKNHRNIKKYVSVGKTFPRAIIQEQLQLSSLIRLEVTAV